MESRVSEKYCDKSIMSDWNELLSDDNFVGVIEDSLNIRNDEKKTRTIDGKRVKGAQMFAIKKALDTGKDKNGAVYFLMRAVHYWRLMYLTEIKHKPDSHLIGKSVSSKLHQSVKASLYTEIEELTDLLEGRGVVPEKEHNDMRIELDSKIYDLERENKKLKSSVEKDKESIEMYYKKKAESDCQMLQKKIDWLEQEIQKVCKTQNKELLAEHQ